MDAAVVRDADPDWTWWRDGVIYHVYLRSFADSDGDGLGDLPGLISRLDYLNGAGDSLGVDAIWLSPCFPSPDRDFGYDVADYTAIDPRFGTMADFDRLVDGAHRRGIRVLLDLVYNHTSDEHAWFRQSRSSRDDPRRGWYEWRDGRPGGGPPNNWKSVFGGRAWTWDPATRAYYHHLFGREQPDLNWRNPEVRNALGEAARFWLDRGVDGFRLDVFNAAVHEITNAAAGGMDSGGHYVIQQIGGADLCVYVAFGAAPAVATCRRGFHLRDSIPWEFVSRAQGDRVWVVKAVDGTANCDVTFCSTSGGAGA